MVTSELPPGICLTRRHSSRMSQEQDMGRCESVSLKFCDGLLMTRQEWGFLMTEGRCA